MKIKPKQDASRKVNPMTLLKDKVTKELEEKKIELFRPQDIGGSLNIDTHYLTLPRDLTDVESRELGRYLNAFTQQRMYIRTLIGWQSLNLEEAKREYYEVSTPIYTSLDRKEFPSETSKERYLNNHPQVKASFFKYRDEKRKLEILQMNLLSLDDAVFLVSREISRRGGDMYTDSRNENVQRK